MLSVSEALDLLTQHIHAAETRTIPLQQSLGFVLAEDVLAPMSFPNVAQAAVDGYGFAWRKKNGDEEFLTLPLQASVQAGDTSSVTLKPEHAIRIFTGAKVPEGVDCIVMQEFVTRNNADEIGIPWDQVKAQANIRATASQCAAGDKLLLKHDVLTPGAMALLASVGISHVTVFPKPKIAILPTGKELIPIGQPILPGQVYESNSISLSAALQQLRIEHVVLPSAEDDLEHLIEQIKEALTQCDMLLITGGVSVGDYDFVLQACEGNGVHKLFHKVKQRPGKPLFFGMKNKQVIFGLPGNPASVLSCFYLFVYPALQLYAANKSLHLPSLTMTLQQDVSKKKGLTFFLRAEWSPEGVRIPQAQESYKMNAFASANAILELEEDQENYHTGDKVKVYLLPS